MARRHDWLDRFRPVGTPGRPAAPGIPADARSADRELDPVFSALEPTHDECERIRADARRDAESRRAQAQAQAAAVRAAASEHAPVARAEAATAAVRSAADASPALDADGARLRRRLERRAVPVVEAVAAQARRLLSDVTDVDLEDPAAQVPPAGSRSQSDRDGALAGPRRVT